MRGYYLPQWATCACLKLRANLQTVHNTFLLYMSVRRGPSELMRPHPRWCPLPRDRPYESPDMTQHGHLSKQAVLIVQLLPSFSCSC